jgi:hypothetical protein
MFAGHSGHEQGASGRSTSLLQRASSCVIEAIKRVYREPISDATVVVSVIVLQEQAKVRWLLLRGCKLLFPVSQSLDQPFVVYRYQVLSQSVSLSMSRKRYLRFQAVVWACGASFASGVDATSPFGFGNVWATSEAMVMSICCCRRSMCCRFGIQRS